MPLNKKSTYVSFVCGRRPLKKEEWRIRMVVGGDKLPYVHDSGSPATDLTEANILFNSVISDAHKGARFLSLDLKDMFLKTTMEEPEFFRVPYKYIPEDIRKRYRLDTKVHEGYIYCRIKKGMYGLKQAAILAHKVLSNLLQKAGYSKITGSKGMWKHQTRKTILSLCVDDFGVKYFSHDDVNHLKTTLEQVYDVTIDWKGEKILGYHLNWNYAKQYVDLSMHNYIPQLLQKLQYKQNKYPQYSPHAYVTIKWTNKGDCQFAMQEDTSPLLNPKETRYVQSAIGSLLYYACVLDSTLLPTLNQLGASQTTPTENTKKAI